MSYKAQSNSCAFFYFIHAAEARRCHILKIMILWVNELHEMKMAKLIDENGKKVYTTTKEAHLQALNQLRKDYGIWYEAR